MAKPSQNDGVVVLGGNVQVGTLAVGRQARAISIGANESGGLDQPQPLTAQDLSVTAGKATAESAAREWDAFISHASEDKQTFVAPLARALQQRGLKIWYDDFTLTVGSSLRESIDFGLLKSRFGIVVLSPNFFAKDWTHQEVNALLSREIGGVRVILPVWHNVTREQVISFSPILVDRVAVRSSEGLPMVVEKLIRAVGRDR